MGANFTLQKAQLDDLPIPTIREMIYKQFLNG